MSVPVSWAAYRWPGAEREGFRVVATPDGVARLDLFEESPFASRSSGAARSVTRVGSGGPECAALDAASEELKAYFAGQLEDFEMPIDWARAEWMAKFAKDELPDEVPGWTSKDSKDPSFSRKVWVEMAKIPFGDLWTYGELAERSGVGKAAVRAVGGAVGRNPLSLVVP